MNASHPLGFLARFVSVLLLVAIGVAVGLSYAFARAHLAAVRRDLVATTIGQASAQLQAPLTTFAHRRGMTPDTRVRLAFAINNIENFQALVRDVRIYAPDGRALVPDDAPAQPVQTARAIAAQDVVQSTPFERGGDQLVSAYIPFGAPGANGYVAVAAIDLSIGQLNAQTASETRYVIVATLIACALIFASLLTLAIAAQRELNKRQRAAETTFLQTMEGIAAIVDQRDPYTAGHSRRVATYAEILAQHLGFSKQDVAHVRWGALLHDVGKIGVPDDVLLKPGALDEHERAVISAHPSIAYEILGPVEAMAPIVPCVLHHHERWDGKGYPSGLADEAIPKLARVVAIADTFDAMTSDRPYRTRLSIEETRRRLLEGANVQWDAQYVEMMVSLIDRGIIAPLPSQAPARFGRRLTVERQT